MRRDKSTVKEVTEEREEERITAQEEFKENIANVTSVNVKMDLDREERELVGAQGDTNI